MVETAERRNQQKSEQIHCLPVSKSPDGYCLYFEMISSQPITTTHQISQPKHDAKTKALHRTTGNCRQLFDNLFHFYGFGGDQSEYASEMPPL